VVSVVELSEPDLDMQDVDASRLPHVWTVTIHRGFHLDIPGDGVNVKHRHIAYKIYGVNVKHRHIAYKIYGLVILVEYYLTPMHTLISFISVSPLTLTMWPFKMKIS